MISSQAPSNLDSASHAYVMIVGHGRSGTNWLLDLLDMSDQTHCRNEANELDPSSPWGLLPEPWLANTDAGMLSQHWDAAVAHAVTHLGYRDHYLKGDKRHIHALGRRLGTDRVIKGRRFRKMLGLVMPELRRPNWRAPGWYVNHARLHEAMLVLKLNSVPGWVTWVMTHRPQARMIHIMRHPAGYLNSWANRWLKRNDAAQVHRLNAQRLQLIADAEPQWTARFGTIDALSTEASELWFWRYANEAIRAAGLASPRYLAIVYEQLVAQPLETAQQAYSFCGLPWTPAIAHAIVSTATESESIASAWRSKLTPQQVELVLSVMRDSPLKSLWPGEFD